MTRNTDDQIQTIIINYSNFNKRAIAKQFSFLFKGTTILQQPFFFKIYYENLQHETLVCRYQSAL